MFHFTRTEKARHLKAVEVETSTSRMLLKNTPTCPQPKTDHPAAPWTGPTRKQVDTVQLMYEMVDRLLTRVYPYLLLLAALYLLIHLLLYLFRPLPV